MSGAAGETKESHCRTKGLACVLESVQSLGTELWNSAPNAKIWLPTLSAPQLSPIPNHPPQDCKGTVGRRRIELEFDFLSLRCYITNRMLAENLKLRVVLNIVPIGPTQFFSS